MADTENRAKPGELKPCPMCGNPEPVLYDFDDRDWAVECGKCKVQTIMVDTRAQAVADWNMRAPTTEDGKAEIARLREALEKIANARGAGGGPNAAAIAWGALRNVAKPIPS